MPNPLHLFGFDRRVRARRRRAVPVPTALPRTDAVFLVMRRMRAPFLVVITTFSFCTAGLTFIPGTDGQGNPYRMTAFDAIYQMTMTVTTVGYTEAPYAFSYPQRMWVMMSIFLLVVSWAYALGVFFSLLQEPAFVDAVATQRFRRRVRRLREPFTIIAGYGLAGRTVGAELDERRRRFVVLDNQRSKVETVATEQFAADVPAVEGDCRQPAMLGVAGLDRPACAGVLALTDDDSANLAVVMAVSVLRPGVPVLARCSSHVFQDRMEQFGPEAVINPDDRFGNYLALEMLRPVTHQLLMWLMDNDENHLPAIRNGLGRGRWIVCADGAFGDLVTTDLREAGVEVDLTHPRDGAPRDSGITGFVSGTDDDIVNIALAEQVRLTNPEAHIVVRQKNAANKAVLAGLRVDHVYIATELVAREVLARTLTPVFWRFAELAVAQDEAWAIALRDRLVERLGRRTPDRDLLTLSMADAPGLVHWLSRGMPFTLGDLVRDPGDRSAELPVVPLLLARGDDILITPGSDVPVRVDDQVLLVGSGEGLGRLAEVLLYDDAVEYAATGRVVPTTWVWRTLTAARRDRRQAAGV